MRSAQMVATLWSLKCVGLHGLGNVWKVKPCDCIAVEGLEFIRVCPYNSSLISLVCEQNSVALCNGARPSSLTGSVAIQRLMRTRNAVQAEELAATLREEECSLFQTPQKEPKRRRVSLVCRRQQRTAEPKSMVISVEHDGECHEVSVLRCTQPRDGLFVRYDEQTLTFLLRYIRESNFEHENAPFKRDPLKPRGIWKKNASAFVVPYEKEGDTTRTKTFHELDEAKSFLATVRDGSRIGDLDALAEVDGGLAAGAACIDA